MSAPSGTRLSGPCACRAKRRHEAWRQWGATWNRAKFPLSDREFARIKARVYEVAGISLSDAKRTLVVSRLSKIVRGLGLADRFDAYLDYLERGGTAAGRRRTSSTR